MRRIAALVLVVSLFGAGMAIPAASVAADSPVESIASMETSYDPDTPSQKIRVGVTVEAQETTLSDITVRFGSGPLTQIQRDSYTTTVHPSNQGVTVTPTGPNSFRIEELEPGERVRIGFSVIPSTLEQQRLTPAIAAVELTRYGQQIDGQVAQDADLSGNPWFTATADGPPNWAIGLAVVAAIVLGGGLATVFARRQRTADRRDLYRTVTNKLDMVNRADDQTLERRLNRVKNTLADELNIDREEGEPADTERSSEDATSPSLLARLGLGDTSNDSTGPNL